VRQTAAAKDRVPAPECTSVKCVTERGGELSGGAGRTLSGQGL
jgi:hypothetical protein